MKDVIKKIKQLPPPAVLTALALVAALSLAAGRHVQAGENDEPKKGPSLHLTMDDSPVAREGKYFASFSPVVKKVAPSVVTVTTTSKPIRQNFGFELPPEFRRFFGGGGPGMENGAPQRQRGLGSGVIVTKDGYILTNNHVVDGADKIEVTLGDGRTFKDVRVIGRDEKSDVAILKIKADDLPFATMADSDKIETGDIVLAIGNPFGIGQTVTMGMVSATGRASVMGNKEGYEDFIQTDAAINPGNSGGALVDTEGRLVGVNTAILSRSGGNQGIGFAIPSDLARRVMISLVRDGRVVRGFMGVSIQDVDPGLARAFKLEGNHGALIAEVVPKGAADKAGIKDGDIVVKFNGKKVSDSSHLRLEVSETAPGTKVPVEVVRDGDPRSFEVVLQELASDKAKPANAEESSNSDTLNGVGVRDLDSEMRTELQVPSKIHGVVVTDITLDSPSYEQGLRKGDVIVEINRKPVHSANEAVEMTSKVKDLHTLLRVWHRDPESGQAGIHYLDIDESKGN